MEKIAFDVHRRYTFVSVDDGDGNVVEEGRIDHERGVFTAFLSKYRSGTPVAVETTGNWYWIVDEIEAAGLVPLLVHARKAKVMLGCINKTDRLDARGLNRLQRVGTLPTVWIPPGDLRNQRELSRTRMRLVCLRTTLKNRVHSSLAKYGLSMTGVTDIYGVSGRKLLAQQLGYLPPETRFTVETQLAQIDMLTAATEEIEKRIKLVCEPTPAIGLLRSLPGIGFVLSVVIALELGEISRFDGPGKVAAYSGTTPRVHASGGRQRQGRLRRDVNSSLKWAFIEAANVVSRYRRHWPSRYVTCLYNRIRQKKGHGTAVGAVARHLAESAYWVLTRQEEYREKKVSTVVSTGV